VVVTTTKITMATNTTFDVSSKPSQMARNGYRISRGIPLKNARNGSATRRRNSDRPSAQPSRTPKAIPIAQPTISTFSVDQTLFHSVPSSNQVRRYEPVSRGVPNTNVSSQPSRDPQYQTPMSAATNATCRAGIQSAFRTRAIG